MRLRFPRLFLLILGCLLLVNLIQAGATQLIYDEAYYWYYAQYPAWGYFDHPPMVGWMIALGGVFFEGELGVRLLSCLMGIGTFLAVWEMIDHPGKKDHIPAISAWLFSIVLLNAYGFLSLPDTPLLFFSALFLSLYKKFLSKPGPWIALLLGLSMAAMMYSKYHGALVILFVVFSNPSLLKNRLAWLALLVSLLAYTPHLLWLYQEDFVSVRYHLFERPNEAYRFTKFTLGFFLNLIALFGLTFPWVFKGLIAFRPSDRFEKSLVSVIYGVVLFFFLSSFQRRVQTQWLIVICIPIAVILSRYIIASEGSFRKWMIRAASINILVILVLRIGLVHRPLFPIRYESHGNKRWVRAVDSVSGDARVIFENSYRLASMYGFYSGKESFSINNAYYRKNQYSIDDSEARMQGKKVFFVRRYGPKTPYSYTHAKGYVKYGQFIDSLVSYRKLEAGIRAREEILRPGAQVEFWVRNPYQKAVDLSVLYYGLAYMDPYKEVQQTIPVRPELELPDEAVLSPGDTLRFEVRLPEPEKGSPRYIRALLRHEDMPWGLNGTAQEIEE